MQALLGDLFCSSGRMDQAGEKQGEKLRGEELKIGRLNDAEKKTGEEGDASSMRKVDDVWERKVWFESHQSSTSWQSLP